MTDLTLNDFRDHTESRMIKILEYEADLCRKDPVAKKGMKKKRRFYDLFFSLKQYCHRYLLSFNRS